MLDASEEFTQEDEEILESIRDLNHLIAINKIDKATPAKMDSLTDNLKSQISNFKSQILAVSAKTGEGLDNLKRAIVEPFEPQEFSDAGFLVTDARHHDLLLRSQSEIENSLSLFDQKTSEEIVLIGLHNALRYLGQITGETTTEDMLTRIFSTFCIGK
jgi:tRNA modification GTPase